MYLKNNQKLLVGFLFLLLVLTLTSCKWPIATYNEIEVIKKEALALVDKSTNDDFAIHQVATSNLSQRINTIISNKTPKAGTKMLSVINTEEKNLWGGFVKLWRTQGKINATAIPGIKQNMETAFNEALALGK